MFQEGRHYVNVQLVKRNRVYFPSVFELELQRTKRCVVWSDSEEPLALRRLQNPNCLYDKLRYHSFFLLDQDSEVYRFVLLLGRLLEYLFIYEFVCGLRYARAFLRCHNRCLFS